MSCNILILLTCASFGSAIRVRNTANRQSCPKTVDLKGYTDPRSEITRFTFKYADAPRFEESKLLDIPSSGPALDVSHPGEKCLQSLCLACGWNVINKQAVTEGVEDCLFLSFFLQKQKDLQPILFHIHHGQGLYGWKADFGDVDGVASRGIAVVTTNHRVGPLGLFAHPEIKNPNFMFLDIINALRFVKKNACAVGADSSRVTLVGSSSAGSAVLALLGSPAAKGLFSGAWVNSPVGLGSRGSYFTLSPEEFYETQSKHCVEDTECDTLDCMKKMDIQVLIKKMVASKSKKCSLSKYSEGVNKGTQFPPFNPYDNQNVVPNMQELFCTQNLASANVPLVIGDAVDEMDSLKFQFGDAEKGVEKMMQGLSQLGSKDPAIQDCIAKKLEVASSHQGSLEDLSFHLPTYMYSTVNNRNVGPRWHFTVTAKTSINGRTWHTTPEILVWNISKAATSPLYHSLTQAFVVDQLKPELQDYMAENFQHFIKTGRVKDAKWPQTEQVAPGHLGGLPSVDLEDTPEVSKLNRNYLHTITDSLHSLMCNNKVPEEDARSKSPTIDFKQCFTNPQGEATTFEERKRHWLTNMEDHWADMKAGYQYSKGMKRLAKKSEEQDKPLLHPDTKKPDDMKIMNHLWPMKVPTQQEIMWAMMHPTAPPQ